jgi:hypothetical protein
MRRGCGDRLLEGYLTPDPGVNLRKFRNKRRGEIRRL